MRPSRHQGFPYTELHRLNTCLTVRAHEANSHQKQGWEQFTQRVIDLVAANCDKGVVFIAWGKPASERVKKIDTKKHLKLESVHPSPLSAARGFFDCAHFVKANDWLTTKYGIDSVVNWDCLAVGNQDQKKAVSSDHESKRPIPNLEDEVGQVGPTGAAVVNEAQRQPNPAALSTEESFGITTEEEAFFANVEDTGDVKQ